MHKGRPFTGTEAHYVPYRDRRSPLGYDLGGRAFGDPRSSVQLSPDWQGKPPRGAEVRIAHRAGCDINPMDPVRDGERLLAYVWPDQPKRLERTAAALKLAQSHPVPIAKADAANWIARPEIIENPSRWRPAGVFEIAVAGTAAANSKRTLHFTGLTIPEVCLTLRRGWCRGSSTSSERVVRSAPRTARR